MTSGVTCRCGSPFARQPWCEVGDHFVGALKVIMGQGRDDKLEKLGRLAEGHIGFVYFRSADYC